MWSAMLISGARGRDGRSGFDAMLKAAGLQRTRFDVVMVWSVDRLGRSLDACAEDGTVRTTLLAFCQRRQ
jgi:DNA invertase Pin-like site-specific DNA recombinase